MVRGTQPAALLSGPLLLADEGAVLAAGEPVGPTTILLVTGLASAAIALCLRWRRLYRRRVKTR